MLSRTSGSSLLSASLWLLLSSSVQQAAAGPFPKDGTNAANFGYLFQRDCAVPCGYQDQYCCEAGAQCTTAAGIAGCAAYNYYTTTWTETKTYTKTWSSAIPAATGANGADCIPQPGTQQKACGPICCAADQYCAYSGQCAQNGGGGIIIGTTVHTGVQTITTQYSAPYRVTSGTATSTGTAAGASQTDDGVSPGGTAGGGLSGGAIAGIVIGTIAGVALLLLICACCLVRGLWHGILAIFGIGKKDRRKSETIIEEERYARRGSSHAHRDSHSSWYGAGGGRPSTVASRKEKKSGTGMLGLGAALGTMALLLGLRKDKNKKKGAVKSRSDISSSYYSDVYTADSPSKFHTHTHTHTMFFHENFVLTYMM